MHFIQLKLSGRYVELGFESVFSENFIVSRLLDVFIRLHALSALACCYIVLVIFVLYNFSYIVTQVLPFERGRGTVCSPYVVEERNLILGEQLFETTIMRRRQAILL